MDASNWSEVDRTFEAAGQALGGLDAVVNCAGMYGPIGSVANNPADEWAAALHANVCGCFHVTKRALSFMEPQRSGSIIHFSGGGAAYGRPNFTAYAASKAAIVRFTESIAGEVIEANVRVNAIAPGPVKSRLWEQLRSAGPAAGANAMEELKRVDSDGGVGPEKAAELAVFLASDQSVGISGRLISALHDDWRNWEAGNSHFAQKPDAGTLRRIPF
jgi:3-oxoacyl-[acyl-carrier protein] reductase